MESKKLWKVALWKILNLVEWTQRIGKNSIKSAHNQKKKKVMGGTSPVVRWIRILRTMGGHRFSFWSGMISQAAEQLSSFCTTAEPVGYSSLKPMQPGLRARKGTGTGSSWASMEGGPHSPQRENACAQQPRPSTAKTNINKEIKCMLGNSWRKIFT